MEHFKLKLNILSKHIDICITYEFIVNFEFTRVLCGVTGNELAR